MKAVNKILNTAKKKKNKQRMEDRNIKFPHREIYLSLQIKEVHEKTKNK